MNSGDFYHKCPICSRAFATAHIRVNFYEIEAAGSCPASGWLWVSRVSSRKINQVATTSVDI